ncbi:MAG TPA: sugar isomerase domain-containing protein [Acidimicrobiales bacterium]
MESIDGTNEASDIKGDEVDSVALSVLRVAGDSVLRPAQEAVENEGPAIASISSRVADAIVNGKKVFTFGAGHAQFFALELFSRAGGLPYFLAMNLEDIRSDKRDASTQMRDSLPEREPANAALLLAHFGVETGDVVLIASNSGRNGAIVEMALECVQRGIYAAGFTSVAHSTAYPSRHPSGKKLMDIVDVVVDNHCPAGDATVEIPGVGTACASSTASYAVLAQMLNRGVIEALVNRGFPVTATVSGNVR